jgi:hypothetical protein
MQKHHKRACRRHTETISTQNKENMGFYCGEGLRSVEGGACND